MIEIGVDPVAFTIGSIEVKWYGIMIALGVLFLVLWSMRQIQKGAEISYDDLFTAALVAIPSGVIFARLLHVIDRWDYYSLYPEKIIAFEGLTIYGAIIGAAFGIWAYSKFSKFRFGYTMDMIAPAVPMAQAIGRVGCILNGCCYGDPTSLPFGIFYTDPDSAGYHASQSLPDGMGLHPTQAYEIIFLLITFAVMLFLRKRIKTEGVLFLTYISLYSLWRFAVGFLRQGTEFMFGLQQAQFLGLCILLVAAVIVVKKYLDNRKTGSSA